MQNETWTLTEGSPRARVIIDNDYSGDPDGLVQLAHHLLCTSIEIPFIIGSHLRKGDHFCPSDKTADESVKQAAKIAELTGRTDIRILAGANDPLVNENTPSGSEASKAIVAEAMRDDTDTPLFVACGGGLSELASAWLTEPAIADRLTLIWIGGHEHDGLAEAPPGGTDMEYNLAIDPLAGQIIFNESKIKIWQIPRNMYRNVLASRDELRTRLLPAGELGAHLYNALGHVNDMINRHGLPKSETYILGDSPLVLLTALTSMFEPDTSSCRHRVIPCPRIMDSGLYEPNPEGRHIRVYTELDNRMLLEDFYAKLQILNTRE